MPEILKQSVGETLIHESLSGNPDQIEKILTARDSAALSRAPTQARDSASLSRAPTNPDVSNGTHRNETGHLRLRSNIFLSISRVLTVIRRAEDRGTLIHIK